MLLLTNKMSSTYTTIALKDDLGWPRMNKEWFACDCLNPKDNTVIVNLQFNYHEACFRSHMDFLS